MSEIFGVVGAGTMGNGIAQVAARAGFEVVMRDVAPEFLARGMASIDKSLQRDVDKERLTAEEKQSIAARIKTTTEVDDLSEAFIVVEAVTEDLAVKSELFKMLDGIVSEGAILVLMLLIVSVVAISRYRVTLD